MGRRVPRHRMESRGAGAGTGYGTAGHRFVRSLAFVLLLTACASSSTPDSPITARITDINPTSDIRFAGPVAIRFRVEVTNPTEESVTLRKVEIPTSASTAFPVRP